MAHGPIGSAAGGTIEPDRAKAQRYDQQLVARARDLSRGFIQFIGLARVVIDEKLYTVIGPGYPDAAAYFDTRIGYSYRTLRRRLTILDGLDRIRDADDRETVQRQLEVLGVHRAAILAPILGQPGVAWRKLLKSAAALDEGGLQAQVTRLIGAKARGTPAAMDAGTPPPIPEMSRWLRYTVNQIVDDGARAELRNIFSAGRVVLESDSDLYVLLALAREQKVEWYHEAAAKGWTAPVEEGGDHVNEPTSPSPVSTERPL